MILLASALLPAFAGEIITKDVPLEVKALEEIGIAYATTIGRDDNLGKDYTDHEFRFTEQKLRWRRITDTVIDAKKQVIAASTTEIDRNGAMVGEDEVFVFRTRVYAGGQVSHVIEFNEPSSGGGDCFRILIKPNRGAEQ